MADCSCAADDPHHIANDLFCARLESMLDMQHSLVWVSHVMPRNELVATIGHALPAVPEGAERQPLSARLVIGLLYLKHAYDLSDEALCERWLESPHFQYFCGEVVFQAWLPCNPSSLTHRRLKPALVDEVDQAFLRPHSGLVWRRCRTQLLRVVRGWPDIELLRAELVV